MQEAVLAIIAQKNRYFLIKRKDLSIWTLPGGGIEKGESAEQAVIREVYEETNLEVAIEKKAALFHPKNSLTVKTHLFICKVIKGKGALSQETTDFGFFSLDQLPKPVFFLHIAWIKELAVTNLPYFERNLTELKFYNVLCFLVKHPLIFFKYCKFRLQLLFSRS